ncbi:lipid-A-disaccharide synthase [Lysobacter sp. KIS68-7]|uniref:lipid-A-disaccharide synthase n=1 Tax=Lysobacter sp. KIS68-7 TaxID=2904252 RepID=UPI001E351C2B|nr:lipid-A-disaccharide synthase [Lysobacter sp. KIS68-7]UHQ19434.1 lipid-A-disaccharide synthase [Lysobacter sp. KIS68-7]
MPPRIGLVAGETSGDQLGAGLIEALRERFPDAEFAGIGGDRMREAGLDAWHDASELAVMGLAEVLAHLPRLLRVRRALRTRMLAWKPDVFIGIDAPDFNLGVERWLKQRGVRTVHDVSPSVWAWRESRAEKIGRSADRVLCLFPMEPPIYARHGVDARYIGHPLADALPLEPDRNAAREALGIAADERALAILPGSRLGEIHRLGRIFFDAAALLAKQFPGLHVVVPAANAACRQAIESLRPAGIANLHVLDGHAQRAMIASDAVLLASGTAALEAMLCKRPMVVAYKLAPISHAIVRTFGLLKVEHVSLPNVLAGEGLVPELLQDACTADKLAKALAPYLGTPEPGLLLQQRFRDMHLMLRRDASARAADAVAELLAEPAPRLA